MTQDNPLHYRIGAPPVAALPVPPQKKGMSTTIKVLLGIGGGVAVLGVLCCIGAIIKIGSGETNKVAGTPPPTRAAVAPQSPAVPSASATPQASISPAAPAAPAIPADKVYKGKGDKVVRLAALGDDPFIARITSKGSENFVVWSVDGGGERLDLLVNEIGAYSGTVPLNFEDDPVALQIEASGTWTVTVQSLVKAPQWSGSKSGRGDSVLIIPKGTLAELATLKITHSGRSNFVVKAWSDSGADLVVNDIGKYSGEVLVASDVVVLEINADGAWTVQKSA